MLEALAAITIACGGALETKLTIENGKIEYVNPDGSEKFELIPTTVQSVYPTEGEAIQILGYKKGNKRKEFDLTIPTTKSKNLTTTIEFIKWDKDSGSGQSLGTYPLDCKPYKIAPLAD